MAITREDLEKGLYIEHLKSGNLFNYNRGFIIIDSERYIVTSIQSDHLVASGRVFWYTDCQLSRLNFTECPHCKKLF